MYIVIDLILFEIVDVQNNNACALPAQVPNIWFTIRMRQITDKQT